MFRRCLGLPAEWRDPGVVNRERGPSCLYDDRKSIALDADALRDGRESGAVGKRVDRTTRPVRAEQLIRDCFTYALIVGTHGWSHFTALDAFVECWCTSMDRSHIDIAHTYAATRGTSSVACSTTAATERSRSSGSAIALTTLAFTALPSAL